MHFIRRAFRALPDAVWLRRQLTADADLVHDVKHGTRILRKSATFTMAAVAVLALGIGGTVSIVTILDTLLFRPLPYLDADRIMTVWQQSRTAAEPEDVAPANFLDWRSRSQTFSHLAAAIPYSWDDTDNSRPEVLFGANVTEGFWEALGVRPILGRTFVGDDYSGRRRVALISHGLWVRRFGRDPGIIDRTISLDGVAWMVVGVLPQDFAPQLFPRPGDLSVWTPKIVASHEYRTRGSAWWNVVGRLKPDVTPDAAQAEMDSIAAALAAEYPRTNQGSRIRVVPLRDHLMGEVRLPLFAMLVAIVLVLGIGCANVASLLLARGAERRREFAIRAALGAGRMRLVRQLVTESLLLSMLSAAGGVAVAYWGIGAIVALAPGPLVLQYAAMDERILLFATVLATIAAVAFGLVPALHFSRADAGLVREHGQGTARRRFRRALVGAEITFAMVLLTGAGLLLRSFERLLAVDPGFVPKNVVMLQVFANDRHSSPDRARVFFTSTIDRLRALPGVQAAGAASAMPFANANIDIQSTLDVVGRAGPTEQDRQGVHVTIATPGYFEAMSIPLREGRHLDDRDTERTRNVAVISDELRRRDWAHESPVGKQIGIRWQGRSITLEIVGVVGQLRHEGLNDRPRAEVFVPLLQVPFTSMTYVMRGSGDPRSLIESARQEVWAVDPLQTFYETATLESRVSASVVRQRFSAILMSVFAFLALVLCATGIYGIVSFTTSQRTREIGVRMALGANPQAIRWMVLKEGTFMIALGLSGGIVGAVLASLPLRALLFDIHALDPPTFATVCVLLTLVGLAACYFPARRATRVDPLIALRSDG